MTTGVYGSGGALPVGVDGGAVEEVQYRAVVPEVEGSCRSPLGHVGDDRGEAVIRADPALNHPESGSRHVDNREVGATAIE